MFNSPSVCSAATSSSRHLFRTLLVVTGAGGKEVVRGGRVGVVGLVGVVGVLGVVGVVGVVGDSPDFLLLNEAEMMR